VQVAEVEVLGTVATTGTRATLTISDGGSGSITISSSVPGALQSTTALAPNGTTTWTDEGPINGSRTNSATGNAKLLRVLAG